jgi:hypothetical protein
MIPEFLSDETLSGIIIKSTSYFINFNTNYLISVNGGTLFS